MPTTTAPRRHRRTSRRTWRLTAAGIMVVAVTGAGTVLTSPRAGAAPDTVSNCSGDPTTPGSLPAVVAAASAGDIVTFSTTCPAGTPLVLAQTLAIGVDLTIDGPGPAAMVVSGGDSVEVMSVADGVTASISGLTIEDGQAATGTTGAGGLNADGTTPGQNGGNGRAGGTGDTGGDGGGIDNSGSLALTDTVVTGNAAGAGGAGGPGGHADGAQGADGFHDTDAGNGGNGGTGGDGGLGGTGGDGGGIYNSGTLSLIASTVTANAAGAGGGGGFGGDAVGGAGGDVAGSPTAPGANGGNGGNGGTGGAGGLGGAGGDGGGIYNSGTVTVVASTVSDNAAGAGGAGGGSGAVVGGAGGLGGVTGANDENGGNGGNGGDAGTSVDGGQGGSGGAGGGIADTDTATLTNSTVAGNVAGTGGGGGGAGSAVGGAGGAGGEAVAGGAGGNGGNGGVGGTAGDGGDGGTGGAGGGLTDAGSLTLTSTTIASNEAETGGNPGDGGSAAGGPGGTGGQGEPAGSGGGHGTSTTAGGGAGAGGADGGGGGIAGAGSLTVGATIVNDNAPANCVLGGTVTDAGYNLDSGVSCGFTLSSDIVAVDAGLHPLQANGGPTFTMAPSLDPQSRAVDVVPADQCPATDQRGAPRTAPCDMGAYDTDQAPFISAIDVAVSGFQTFDSSSPTFTESNDAPGGVTVTGPTGCATVDGGTPISSGLAIADYTIDGASCTGLVSSNAQYPIFPSTTVGATNGFVVTKDTTSVGLSAVPSSEAFGREGSTLFTVTVSTGNGEELAGTENVTVDVGSTDCVAPVAPATGGGSGSCFIGNSVLGAGAYTASANYQGDTDLQGSGPADAAFTVTLALTPPPLPNPLFNVPYSTTLTAGGATAPTTFTEMGNLPDGITLHTSGVLSGTATNAAQIGMPFPFTVTATDSAHPANVATQLYTITVTSPCSPALTTIALSATARTGDFTGVFCVNAAGSGTYIQGTVHGTGSVTSAHGVTTISAFGTDLSLLGQKTTTTSTFTEMAPAPMKAGTFTLTTVAPAS